jgi:hypothetical protein
MDFAVMQACFVDWVFAVLAPRGYTTPHGMPMPNVPSGPLLFVIGTPNVAALYWRGRWQKNSDQATSDQTLYCDYHRAKPQAYAIAGRVLEQRTRHKANTA